MNQAEYDKFTNPQLSVAALRGAALLNKTPRTLIYGYTCNRDTFHVYLDEDGILQRVIYDSDGLMLSHDDESTLRLVSEYCPEKRAYPEACDLAFCRLLQDAGAEIPFTVFTAERQPADWYGKRKEDLIVVEPDDHLEPIVFSVEEFNLGLSPYLSEDKAREMESQVSAAVTEMFDKVYRRVKYLKSDELPRWLASLPGNVEWTIRKVYESLRSMEPVEFQLDPEAADAMRTKVKAAVLARLPPVAG